MIRTRSSLAGQTFSACEHLACETRPGPASAVHVSKVCIYFLPHVVLLPCVHARSKGRVIGLSVRGAHKNQQFEHAQ